MGKSKVGSDTNQGKILKPMEKGEAAYAKKPRKALAEYKRREPPPKE